MTLLALGILVLAGCSGDAGGDPTDRTWQLTELEGAPPLDGTSIELTIEEGTVSGGSGCNQYTGPAVVGDEGSMTLGPDFAITFMACDQPITDQEQSYLTALASVETFTIENDALLLADGNGEVVARFE